MVTTTPVVDLFDFKKGKKKELYATGYYSLGGAVAGFLLSYLWDKFQLPEHTIKEGLLTKNPLPENSKEISIERTVAVIISVGLMMSEMIGIKGGFASGAGFLLGNTAAIDFRHGKYLGHT